MHLTKSNLFKKFLYIVFPKSCISCSKAIDIKKEKPICDKCIKGFTKVDSLKFKCNKCGRIIEYNGLCTMCSSEKEYYDSGICVYEYSHSLRDAIINYKFKGLHYHSKYFGNVMAENLHNTSDYDIITFVPLHKIKHKQRGYNQAELLAKVISEIHGITLCQALTKVKNTRQQSTLSSKEREINVRNAFKCSADVKNKSILIVDDILTTGHTINECSRILKKAGAKRVDFITLACVHH